jgi:hypothetical protein
MLKHAVPPGEIYDYPWLCKDPYDSMIVFTGCRENECSGVRSHEMTTYRIATIPSEFNYPGGEVDRRISGE